MTVALLVAKLISSYQGYQKRKRKEDDHAVRRKILTNIDEAQSHLVHAMSSAPHDSAATLKAMVDKLDILANTIEYSFSGHDYPFFSPHTSVSNRTLKKIMTFDLAILERASDIVEQCDTIHKIMRSHEENDTAQHIAMLKQQIAALQNEYSDRIDLIRGISFP